jgi:YegS/Rv2252/BmrU family lipid kinase
MRPPLLIVNPACGARGSAHDLPQVLGAVEKTLGDVVIRYTARRGHARELALQGTREGYSLIVAVGGDGTFSEVANGIIDARGAASAAASVPPAGDDGPAVGLINIGTGGDFRRSLGIESGYERCLEALALGRERTVDVGRASFLGPDGERVERHFVNVLSAGVGGLVDRYVDSLPGFIGGRAGYYLASLRAVAASKEQPLLCRVTWEGETREEVIPAYIVAVCNGRWFGGGMDIAPMALPDDGRLEVVTITEHTKRALARKVNLVYTGRHLAVPTVHHFPCHRIELRLEDETAERRFLLDVDGDPLGSLPLAVEVVPHGLRVRA